MARLFDERNDAVKRMIASAIRSSPAFSSATGSTR
ncbi:MAG: hypothetical protein ABSB15_25775 [Bryobacteraceae bacterium]